MIERPSARLILLDPRDRLFLFKVHQPSVYDPADPFRDPFWIMIGGLVDPGEDFAETAVREAREETGLVLSDVRWVWSRERVMQWRDRQVLHRERFFLGRTPTSEVDTSGLDEREKVFTRFHSVRPEEDFGRHSGLGLAIARAIVDGHGGSIDIEDRDDGASGARFVVRFPGPGA